MHLSLDLWLWCDYNLTGLHSEEETEQAASGYQNRNPKASADANCRHCWQLYFMMNKQLVLLLLVVANVLAALLLVWCVRRMKSFSSMESRLWDRFDYWETPAPAGNKGEKQQMAGEKAAEMKMKMFTR